MKNFLIFDNKRSSDYGLYISGSGAFNAPERDVEVVEIAGRNGNLILDNGRFRNITVSYPAFISRDFPKQAAAARDWLCGRVGYFRLEDTYHPEFFRLARFAGPVDFEMRFQNYGGETNLHFDCKPQRFLKSGEHPIAITGKTTLRNPTGHTALPLIRVYGSGNGQLSVGEAVVQITGLDTMLVLDSDLQDAYKGAENMNDRVSLSAFPSLPMGGTEVSFSGGITKIEIIPRWWSI